ncbi:MAG: hypothetical protein OHK0022_54960 [Roseiflexaceae bacterium]
MTETDHISPEQHDHGGGAPDLRTVRHELRTPVNHIIGYSEMLLEEAADAQEDDLAPGLQRIVQLGKQLLAQINEALADDQRAELAAGLGQVRQTIQAPLDQIVAASTELQGRAAAQGQIGEDLEKISQAALRLMALVSADLQLAQSGAPAAAPAATPPEPPAEPRPGTAEGHLLVVDDNELNRDMLSRRLERLGYTVDLAENGRQALEIIRAKPFDLILLDLMMPEMDGYEVLERLKADPDQRHIPVIVLSAIDEISSVATCIEIGAEDHLLKPFDPVLLRARIGACLEKKRLHDRSVAYLQQIEREKKRVDALLHVVIPIGVALSGEKDFNQLLERIIMEARRLCNADGGTLYLRTEHDTLMFVIVRTESLGVAMGGTTGTPIPYPPLRMHDERGRPNDHYVVVHTALTGRSINIPDAYDADGFDFSGTRLFDSQTGYRTTSLLNVPLKNEAGEVIGVIQLLNALDPDGVVIPFDIGQQQMVESLSALASVALGAYIREQGLRQQIEDLKIEIDEARKARQVAEITETDYFQNLREKARRMRKS